jgi:hypothetical protein
MVQVSLHLLSEPRVAEEVYPLRPRAARVARLRLAQEPLKIAVATAELDQQTTTLQVEVARAVLTDPAAMVALVMPIQHQVVSAVAVAARAAAALVLAAQRAEQPQQH